MKIGKAYPVYRFSRGDIIRDEKNTLYVMHDYMPHMAMATVVRLDRTETQIYVRETIQHDTLFQLVVSADALHSAYLTSESVRGAVKQFVTEHANVYA